MESISITEVRDLQDVLGFPRQHVCGSFVHDPNDMYHTIYFVEGRDESGVMEVYAIVFVQCIVAETDNNYIIHNLTGHWRRAKYMKDTNLLKNDHEAFYGDDTEGPMFTNKKDNTVTFVVQEVGTFTMQLYKGNVSRMVYMPDKYLYDRVSKVLADSGGHIFYLDRVNVTIVDDSFDFTLSNITDDDTDIFIMNLDDMNSRVLVNRASTTARKSNSLDDFLIFFNEFDPWNHNIVIKDPILTLMEYPKPFIGKR